MTIAVVTGANGFLGSRVVERLLAEGMTVRALVRRPETAPVGAEAYLGDVTDAEAVAKAMEGASLVVHTAAVAGPDKESSLRVNGEGTRVLAEAALKAGARLVHISTDAVYDFTGGPTIVETTPYGAGDSPYEAGKIAAELAVRAAEAQGLKAVILRPTCILGAHPTSTWAVKVPTAIQAGRFKLFGQGEGTFPYIHVENLVDCILLAATRDQAVGQAYDTNDGNVTWREYAEHFERELGFPAPQCLPMESAPAFFRWQGTIPATKIREQLGYSPRLTYAEGMAEAVAYLKG